jgi:excisionase family DNA binding protein
MIWCQSTPNKKEKPLMEVKLNIDDTRLISMLEQILAQQKGMLSLLDSIICSAPESRSNQHQDDILRLKDLCELLKLSRSTIYKMMSEGRFPQSVRLGEKAVGWKRSDILGWVNR